MKAKQLYSGIEERTAAREAIGEKMCEQIGDFTQAIFYQCELRGELLSDEEVIDITVATMFDLLRHTKDYDGM